MAEPCSLQRVVDEIGEKQLIHALRLRERAREYRSRIKDWKPEGLDAEQAAVVRDVVERVHVDGYAVVPGFLNEQRRAQLRESLEPMFEGTRRISERLGRAFSGKSATELQTVHVANLLAKTTAADDIVVDRFLLAIIRGVLGPHFQVNTCVGMCPDPGTARQAFHRDEGFFKLHGHSEYGYPRMPVVANTLIALDDFTQANGATLMIPRSQTWDEARAPQMSDVVYNEMTAGSLAIFDGSLYHAGGGNSTADKRRRSLNINFTRDWLRTQENHFLSIPRQRILSMPEELQRLLGYSRSAHGLGGCDYQDPLKYLRRLVKFGDGSQPSLAYDAENDPRKTRSKL